MEDKKQPIVVKKVHKGGHGHHGGAWKVAMADFAIAMMAFFMVMWLLGGTSVEQKAAIAEYFNNPSLTEGKSQTAVQGQTGPGGAATSVLQLGGTMELPKGDGQKALEKSHDDTTHDESYRPSKNKLKHKPEPGQTYGDPQQKKMLHALSAGINKALSKKALTQFKDQVIVDISDEGLRIQIVDKENRPMFDLGSSQLKSYTRELLHEIAKMVDKTSSRISITGHTDAIPYVSRADYSNWELSSDRAHSARRAMLEVGVSEARIARVVGLGSTILLDKANPSHPSNRRISIVFLNPPLTESKQPVISPLPNPQNKEALTKDKVTTLPVPQAVIPPKEKVKETAAIELRPENKETLPKDKITTLPVQPAVIPPKEKVKETAPVELRPENQEALPKETLNTTPITPTANPSKVDDEAPPLARPSSKNNETEKPRSRPTSKPPIIKPTPKSTPNWNSVVPSRSLLPNNGIPPIDLPKIYFEPVIDPSLLPGP